jgi:Dolichyl-phosphate-mannose-protein mannosyltransferase
VASRRRGYCYHGASDVGKVGRTVRPFPRVTPPAPALDPPALVAARASWRRRLVCAVARALGRRRRRHRWSWAALVFLAGFAVRSLHAVDLAPALESQAQPGSRMMTRYDEGAAALLRGEGLLLVEGVDPSDTGLLARPPGYSVLLAASYRLVGRGLFAVQLVQNAINALVPVLVFALAETLVSRRAAILSGLMAALIPHLAYYSALLTPDVVCAVPVLVALVLLVPIARGRRLSAGRALAAGAALGLAVWLRPNLLLLGPAVALAMGLIAPRRRRRWRVATAVGLGAVLAIAPITIRNYVLYRAFVPVSINLGIVLWEGLGEASGNAWGTRTDDIDVAAQEAQTYGDPRYGEWWASPDGIRRDRDRVRRSLGVIAAHPAWFAGTALRRAAQMLDYAAADAPTVAPRGAVPDRLLDTLHEPGQGRSAAHLYGPELLARLRPRITSRDAVAVGRVVGGLRPALRPVQVALTVLALPLVLAGLAALLVVAPRRAAFLLIVPLYQVAFQSIVHFEFRYVLPMHACLLVLAGTALALLGGVVAARGRRAA